MPRILLALAALTAHHEATACSVSRDPSANLQSEHGAQPIAWLHQIEPDAPVAMNIVDVRCATDKPCASGTQVELQRVGRFIRPKAPLPAKAHVQIVSGTTLLADFTVAAARSPILPAWNGVTIVDTTVQTGYHGCSLRGPKVQVKVNPSKFNLEHTALLVYLAKPDPADPLKGLGTFRELTDTYAIGATMEFGNSVAAPSWMPDATPASLWIALADGDGHVGPATEYKLK